MFKTPFRLLVKRISSLNSEKSTDVIGPEFCKINTGFGMRSVIFVAISYQIKTIIKCLNSNIILLFNIDFLRFLLVKLF